jgi:hypothetical protein
MGSLARYDLKQDLSIYLSLRGVQSQSPPTVVSASRLPAFTPTFGKRLPKKDDRIDR